MAKFKALVRFNGYKEEKTFEKDEVFEMTVERSEEIEKNVQENFAHLKIDKVMERLDEPKKKAKEKNDEGAK